MGGLQIPMFKILLHWPQGSAPANLARLAAVLRSPGDAVLAASVLAGHLLCCHRRRRQKLGYQHHQRTLDPTVLQHLLLQAGKGPPVPPCAPPVQPVLAVILRAAKQRHLPWPRCSSCHWSLEVWGVEQGTQALELSVDVRLQL